ncbi:MULTISPECIES: hypothetical protein [Rhodococcus]|uniref:Lipoprotein n=1 Tax=Rhodococcus opacus RKJ300 = JCM 13270 TaxID=1165867 RepID=I0WN67_RHOOP|nr:MULTISPECIES: hypothetical protein [Rhodococcus]EID77833.1 hypothetical protein W59_21613 [Rhodococcus opacus RKJ300 = JCM 13270]QQZ19693.1 hypothetical protein GO592_42875 [Rhodococcus sp. 21391]
MKRAASVSLAILVLAGCGNADSETSQPSSSTRAPASSTTATTSVVAQPAPDVPGQVVVREVDSSCASAEVGAPIDLTEVSVHLGVPGYAGTVARVVWSYQGDLPATGTVLWSLSAADRGGNNAVQLGYKTLDGNQIAYFTFAGAKQQNLSGAPDVSVPGQVTAVLPSAAVAALGSEWHWKATVNVDGEDVDRCPN